MKLDKRNIDVINLVDTNTTAIDIPIQGMSGYSITVTAHGKVVGERPYSEVERNLKNIVANLSLNL